MTITQVTKLKWDSQEEKILHQAYHLACENQYDYMPESVYKLLDQLQSTILKLLEGEVTDE